MFVRLAKYEFVYFKKLPGIAGRIVALRISAIIQKPILSIKKIIY